MNNTHRRGWAVKYNDGSIITEWSFGKPFSHLPAQRDIESVALFHGDKHWVLSGKQHYFSEKRESILVGPGISGGRRLESRTIGYWDDQGRKIKFTVNELTGEAHGPYISEG